MRNAETLLDVIRHRYKTYLLTIRNQLPESRDAVKAARPVRRGNDGKGAIATSPLFYPTQKNFDHI